MPTFPHKVDCGVPALQQNRTIHVTDELHGAARWVVALEQCLSAGDS
jgi:hypothetical protein